MRQQISHLPSHIATLAHRAGFAWRARRAIVRLRQAESAVARTLAGALANALDEETTAAEPAIGRIEALRAALLGSPAEVSFRDYGAATRLRPRQHAPVRDVTRAVGTVCRSSVPPHEGRVLYQLIRRFRPARCLELGTCLGISAAYQAAALARNGAGRLVTLEGGAALARLAEVHLEGLGLPGVEVVPGPFTETLPAVLSAHGPIDFAFVDGHHDPAAMHAYYRILAPHLANAAVLVFDDIAWTSGMRRAWTALTTDRRMRVTVDLLTVGICCYRTRVPA